MTSMTVCSYLTLVLQPPRFGVGVSPSGCMEDYFLAGDEECGAIRSTLYGVIPLPSPKSTVSRKPFRVQKKAEN
jgi:hypothetical protein